MSLLSLFIRTKLCHRKSMHQPKRTYETVSIFFSSFGEVSLTYSTIIATDDYHNLLFATFLKVLEAYLECCQISKMVPFTKILNGFIPLITFAKSSISGAWPGFKYASDILKKAANDKLRFRLVVILVCSLKF